MRSFGTLISIGLLGTATPLLAQTPTAPTQAETPPKPKSSVQQQFEAGTAAINAGDWQRAFDIYAALEKTLGARTPPSKSIGIVRLRKGITLVKLGRADEGEATLNAALAQIPSTDTNMADDRSDALITLGELAERRYDYPGAITRFRAALTDTSNVAVKLAAYSHLIPIGIFVDRDAALADADAALALVAQHPEANKEWPGTLRAMRGRVLMNMGRLKEARADLTKSISQLGGLGTSKINLLDATARSDAAIAALRDNDLQQARLYLAYAGSTQQADQGFRLGRDMNPPSCGDKDGPKPDDVAVIEFNIRDDGSIGVARPIFFSGEPAVAIDFARAVSEWSWSPDELKEVKPFFRALTRLEMRCTTVFEKPSAASILSPKVEEWLYNNTIILANLDENSYARRLPLIKAQLDSAESKNGINSPQLLGLMAHFILNPNTPTLLAEVYARRASLIAQNSSAPASVKAYFSLVYWRYLDGNSYASRPKFQAAIGTALVDPLFTKDPDVSGALRLELFDSYNGSARERIGQTVLQPLIDDTTRPANDPFKVGALVRLATIQNAAGKIDDARALFAKTGLSAQQCALVDARPLRTGGNITDKDYPIEAIRLGFGGWTVVEFDIDASGRTLNQRPLIAWPPFIFGDPAAKNIKGFRYQQSYRPEGGLGCGGQRQRISYLIPK